MSCTSFWCVLHSTVWEDVSLLCVPCRTQGGGPPAGQGVGDGGQEAGGRGAAGAQGVAGNAAELLDGVGGVAAALDGRLQQGPRLQQRLAYGCRLRHIPV